MAVDFGVDPEYRFPNKTKIPRKVAGEEGMSVVRRIVKGLTDVAWEERNRVQAVRDCVESHLTSPEGSGPEVVSQEEEDGCDHLADRSPRVRLECRVEGACDLQEEWLSSRWKIEHKGCWCVWRE